MCVCGGACTYFIVSDNSLVDTFAKNLYAYIINKTTHNASMSLLYETDI